MFVIYDTDTFRAKRTRETKFYLNDEIFSVNSSWVLREKTFPALQTGVELRTVRLVSDLSNATLWILYQIDFFPINDSVSFSYLNPAGSF